MSSQPSYPPLPPPGSGRFDPVGKLTIKPNRGIHPALGPVAALAGGAAFAAAWWGLLAHADTIPLWLTAVSGLGVGALASLGTVDTSLPRGFYALAVTGVSTVVMLYFVARTDLVEELGADYEVPLWTGQEIARELAKGTLDANPIMYPLVIVSLGLAFVYGSGIKRWGS